MKIAIQMDPLANISPEGDSTLALGLGAQTRGHTLYYYTPDTLCLNEQGIPEAMLFPVTLFDDPNRWYELETPSHQPLDGMDVILLRQDPPFDMTYLATTYMLERIHPKTLVVNDPIAVRNTPEKLASLNFSEFTPPTIISQNKSELDAFRQKYHDDVIVKPLYGFGGRSVFHLSPEGHNYNALIETLLEDNLPLVMQAFLSEVATQEKRIILIDGVAVGATGRIPPAGEIRSNLRIGGQEQKTSLTKRQQHICDAVGPWLAKRGILFAGIDVIGDYLIEINVTSPTGIRQVNRLDNISVESFFWDAVEKRRTTT